jgi:hypothetical protein
MPGPLSITPRQGRSWRCVGSITIYGDVPKESSRVGHPMKMCVMSRMSLSSVRCRKQDSSMVFLRLPDDEFLPFGIVKGIGDGKIPLSSRSEWLMRRMSSRESSGASLKAWTKEWADSSAGITPSFRMVRENASSGPKSGAWEHTCPNGYARAVTRHSLASDTLYQWGLEGGQIGSSRV